MKQLSVGGPLPPGYQPQPIIFDGINRHTAAMDKGALTCLDLAQALSATTSADLALYNLRRPAVANLRRGLFGIALQPLAVGERGKVCVFGDISEALIASSDTGTTDASKNDDLWVTANQLYMDTIAPSTATNGLAAQASMRLRLGTLLEDVADVNDGSDPVPTLARVMFNGIHTGGAWAPGVANFVADATAGDAAEINAIRDALVAAGLMAAAAS